MNERNIQMLNDIKEALCHFIVNTARRDYKSMINVEDGIPVLSEVVLAFCEVMRLPDSQFSLIDPTHDYTCDIDKLARVCSNLKEAVERNVCNN